MDCFMACLFEIDWKKYDEEHLYLVEQLKSNKCVLCKHGTKQTIVMNARGLPQDVCDQLKLKRIKEVEEKVKKKLHNKTWQQAEKEKKYDKK